MQVALKYGHQVLSFDGISINTRCLDLLLHFEKRSAVKISNAKLVCNGRFLNIRQTAVEVCCVVCGNHILLENSLFFCEQAGLLENCTLEVFLCMPGGESIFRGEEVRTSSCLCIDKAVWGWGSAGGRATGTRIFQTNWLCLVDGCESPISRIAR